jgi:hypothetical protein
MTNSAPSFAPLVIQSTTFDRVALRLSQIGAIWLSAMLSVFPEIALVEVLDERQAKRGGFRRI